VGARPVGRQALLAVALTLVLACAAPAATPSPEPTPSSTVATLEPTAAGGMSPQPETPSPPPNSFVPASPEPPTAPPSPASSPSRSPLFPPDPAWERVGTINTDYVRVFVGWSGGYVAAGEVDADQRPVVHFSSDGQEWQAALLEAEGCVIDDMVFSPSVAGAATDGEYALLVGSAVVDCYEDQPVSWLTADGLDWQRSVDMPRDTGGLIEVWSVDGGWEAVWRGDEGLAIWRSSDGLRWQETTFLVADELRPYLLAAAASDDGRRLVSISARSPGRETGSAVLTSTDGVEWRQVPPPEGSSAGANVFDFAPGWAAVAAAPPAGSAADAWLVLGEFPLYGDPAEASLWATTDFETWDARVLPDPSTYGLTSLALGYVAHAAGTTYVSPDGVAWAASMSQFGSQVTSGPAGVIALEADEDEESYRVWRLDLDE
jgi:hypothetical protein